MPASRLATFRTQLRAYIHRFVWLIIPLLTIPALWPLYADGLPSRFDRGLHLMRLAWLDQHIRQGTLFPRWVPEMMLGRGYPLFNFYGAGVYYLSEIFLQLGLNFSDASVATLTVLALLAGFGMYRLAQDIFNDYSSHASWGSLVAAIAYVYAPYFLTANIYQRGAIAEATAQALIPWVLWGVRRLFTRHSPAFWATVLALLLAALIFSHTLMLLIFPPMLAGYVLVQWLQNGRQPRALAWAAAGLVAAIAITAFFWLPLVAERDNLSKLAYNIVRGAMLPRGLWGWDTFVAEQWLYTFERPPRLGRVQWLLGMVGALLTIAPLGRKQGGSWEKWYFLLVAVVAGLLAGKWARPFWEQFEILLSIQSPWRLLTLLSFVLAIFTGGLVVNFPIKQAKAVLAILLTGIIIYTNLPRLQGVSFFSRTDSELSPPVLAQLEYEQGVEIGGEGSTFVQEFRPRWASRSLIYTDPPEISAPSLALRPIQGNAYTTVVEVTVEGTESAPLRFNSFYFPGWQVRLGDGSELPAYPSTNLGLLTVDLPPGSHQLTLAWRGTTLQIVAGAISMVALALLAGLTLWRRQRLLAIIPTLLLLVALFATFRRPALATITPPTQPLDAFGVQLLGLRTDQRVASHLYLYPYWYLTERTAGDLQARWQLRDEGGAVQAEILSSPYFNASTAATWPPGTLIDDAYALPLPPGLAAGRYDLVLQLESGGTASTASVVGTITLDSPIPPQTFELDSDIVESNVHFDDEVQLAGYAPAQPKQPPAAEEMPPVFHAGEVIRYRLYWRALQTPRENYHTYVHLLDSTGHAIYHSDQLVGPWFRPPKGWDTYYLQQDTHRLEIPESAPGGLYWPTVGVYEIRRMDRMAVTVDGEPVLGDVWRLPPIKVVGAPATPPIERMARFGDNFHLIGYDLELPEEGLYPGSEIHATLYYRSDAPTTVDYTRFFHLYSPERGLVAQSDSPPQAGVNPTWTWVPGEIIVDPVTLHISEAAAPGDYRLFFGFYDAQAGAVRLAVQDEDGQRLPDDGVVLETVRILSR